MKITKPKIELEKRTEEDIWRIEEEIYIEASASNSKFE